jgi:two-component system sensor histidine kinase/response regulator
MSPTKILVVDDEWELERLIRQRFRKKINSKEIDFIFASNGVEALEKIQAEDIDLVLTDINMPQMDGIALIDAISQMNTSLRAVVISAYSHTSDMRQAMNVGAFDFLAKPIDFRDLEQTIEKTQQHVEQIKARQSAAKDSLLEQEKLKLKAVQNSISLSLPHEINTPLNGIVGFTDLLLKYYSSNFDTDVLEAFESILNSTVRLEKLCQNFLLHARLEVLSTHPEEISRLREKITYSPQDYILECIEIKANNYSRQTDITVDVDSTSIQISENFLNKIIQELIDNALKFSVPGTPIVVRGTNLGQQFRMVVSDRGRGMSAEQIAHLDAYIQFDREEYEQQGMGLGLAVVQRIVQLHDGVFAIESVEGEGTTVTVDLPVAQHA